MSVSGATVLTYTSEDTTEVTGNPYGMKTNLSFTASGDVNGYIVSYMQTSVDQFAGMSSARLSIGMGDMGTLAFDQGSGSGLGTIDDKTPTAAEEIWDGLDGTTVGGLVGTAGSSGVWNYVNSIGGMTFNGAARTGSGTKNSDGSSSGAGESAWDFALTGSGDMLGIDGLSGVLVMVKLTLETTQHRVVIKVKLLTLHCLLTTQWDQLHLVTKYHQLIMVTKVELMKKLSNGVLHLT